MFSTLNHINKAETLVDKRLVIIDSNAKDSTLQSSSSFTYTFNEPITRVSKIDVISAKIPNVFYNINNDNTQMSITTETFTKTITENLILDDTEN